MIWLKKIVKRVFKNNLISNERGSVLSVTLIVITVLAFSVTTLTSTNVNLASSTTYQLEQVGNDLDGKAVISQVIAEFEDYILNVSTYTDYNNVEIPRVLLEYGVVVTDETENIEGYGDFGDIESRAYKFAYTMFDGDVLVKYVYVSNFGTDVENFDPFEFSLATNGNLVLNSGFYDDIDMYGEEIWNAETAPYIYSDWVWDWDSWSWVEEIEYRLTPTNSSQFPDINSSRVYLELSYDYCVSGCQTAYQNGDPFTINESNYSTIDGSAYADPGSIQTDIISDFFTEWDFAAYVIDFTKNEAPRKNDVITDAMTLATLGQVALDNSDPITYKGKKGKIPKTPFVDITGDTHIDFTRDVKMRYAAVHNGDLEFNRDVKVEKKDEAMVIIGDLTINNTDHKTSKVQGAYIITGDLIFTGGTINLEGSFIVLGQIIMDFDEGEGIETTGKNAGITFLAQDNIIIDSFFESHNSSRNDEDFFAFFYTEESFYIDSVYSRFYLKGSIFAKALGNTLNPIFLQDEDSLPVSGIIINSYQGYINGWGNAVPSNNADRNGFIIEKLTHNNYQKRFENLPAFASIVSSVGIYTFESSEWLLE